MERHLIAKLGKLAKLLAMSHSLGLEGLDELVGPRLHIGQTGMRLLSALSQNET